MGETPRCKNYSLPWGLDFPNPIILSGAKLQVQKPFEGWNASGRNLDIHLDGYWIHLICRSSQSPSCDSKLKLGEIGPYSEVLGWLNDMLLVRCPSLSLIPVDLHLKFNSVSGLPLSPSELFRLSNVRSLRISDHRGYTNDLLEALSILSGPENGGSRWVWPTLRELFISAFSYPTTSILHMLKMRTEAALRQKANGGVSEITMLERLEVRANVLTVEEFGDIRAVLGDAAVIGPAAWDEA